MGEPTRTHKVEVDVTMKDSGGSKGPAKFAIWLPAIVGFASALVVAVVNIVGSFGIADRTESGVATRQALQLEAEFTKQSVDQAGMDRRQAYIVEATLHAEGTRTEAAIRLVPGTPVPVPTVETTPTVTSEPTETQVPNSPAATVAAYLQAIQDGRYALAWTMTTADFKQWFNGNIFAGYESFWSSASPLSVVEIVEDPSEPASPFEASVVVRQLWEVDQAVRASRYLLVRSEGTWLIDRVEALP